ncbi:MAG: vitamin B12-dependent ribonucleotide reductase [Calditrichaeota bacterium]|nr:vitamin B12-dependent ribonucleotide reductase [Calditrichota bacterium]
MELVSDSASRGGVQSARRTPTRGLVIPRRFSKPSVHPFDEVEWETREAVIVDEKGEVIFHRRNVEVPKSWSQMATNVVASKYFCTRLRSDFEETSVKQLIERVVRTICTWGMEDGYFATQADAQTYHDELVYLLVNQMASFNSPVWFNLGVEERPQCSACFINSVEDTMESILDLAKVEGLLFKWGSGTGTNLSTLRSSKERVSGGGLASGPVSFMKGYDAFAGVIKSGGKTRRAAKMVILNIDHPDIVEFINCKANEERKAWALIEAGYDGSFDGEAYSSVFFQNSNNSVRVPDAFMQAVKNNEKWHTRAVLDGKIVDTYDAVDLMQMIAQAAHLCGDPGMQFDTTINKWNTCAASGRINASNPCSEFMFLDDSACNLASINLMSFRRDGLEFDTEAFRAAVNIMLIAQDILVDRSSYPTEKITRNSKIFRPLGLGYTNLGALLMSWGVPYDSQQGTALAAAVTALMTGQAYVTSAHMAERLGPFAEFKKNRECMLNVIRMHQQALNDVNAALVPSTLWQAAQKVWEEAVALGEQFGFRNAQVTALAPTGTISFMMDADTTGVEPEVALVKWKRMVGGGKAKLVNTTVPMALKHLGYTPEEIRTIVAYVDAEGTIEGAPHLKPEHLPVFDCAMRPAKGTRCISHMGHIRMLAAVQPFISGSISKTVNMPNDATPQDVMNAYMTAWELGLKCIAIYRDGSKRTQPLSTSAKSENQAETKFKASRRRLPAERRALTHKFNIAGHEGYLTVGLYDDGTPGEIFIVMAKEGSVVSGLMDSFATAISLALQYGVPLKVLVNKFSHTRFEPWGYTDNPDIPFAKSIMDYIFRYLALKFLPPGEQADASGNGQGLQELVAQRPMQTVAAQQRDDEGAGWLSDTPPCPECGSIMIRAGSCYKCLNCGSNTGCGG